MRLVLLLTALLWGAGTSARAAPPNVLMIIVDDMNDWVACLGGHPDVRTPHLDRLARRGLLFTNAHCPAPVCNPSRVAVLTGRAPGSTGIYDNSVVWHEALGDVASLPGHFRRHGYRTLGGGKVNHHMPGFNRASDWDEYFDQVFDSQYQEALRRGAGSKAFRWPEGFPLNGLPEVGGLSNPPANPREFDWGPFDRPDDAMGDGQMVAWAEAFLRRGGKAEGDDPDQRPFFLAAGIYRPHLPMYAPRGYFELYPPASITLPPVLANDGDDLPEGGRRMAADRRGDLELVRRHGRYRELLQAYLANITFADALVGRLLDALEAGPARDHTIVVFWSDHGWHLGEKDHLHKFTLWERSTRVPLVIAAPGTGPRGGVSARPVGLIDLFPTLLELCGLPPVEQLDGRSLVPLLRAPDADWDHPALTTHGRGNHALRSERWRYIRYADGGEELYDHHSDPHEWRNLADSPAHAAVKADLAARLPVVDAAAIQGKGGGKRSADPQPAATQSAAKVSPPNIVLFMVDDLGWRDLGCQGSGYYRTPNIDRLAAEGARFTDAYAACVVCSPTRAAVLTGRYPARLLLTDWLPSGRWDPHARLRPGRFVRSLPLEEWTLAEALRDGGYRTVHVGKWHLGGGPFSLPEHHGFDVNVAGDAHGAPGSYFFPYAGDWAIPSTPLRATWNTLADGRPDEYLTDRLTDEAVAYIRGVGPADAKTAEDRPFFLHLAHYAVHTPLQAPPELVAKYEAVPEEQRQGRPVYAAMVESVDASLGRIMTALGERGIADDTVVIVTSDNGGFAGATSNAPLRANKGASYEGGIRVPLIIRWPGVSRPGSVITEPVTSTDLYPTCLAAAGLPSLPHQHVDGRNLEPLLRRADAAARGGDWEPRPALYWHFPHYNEHPSSVPASVIRKGEWKLIESFDPEGRELYNLADDLGETTDLAASRPDLVAALAADLEAWRRSVGAEPMLPNPDHDPAKIAPEGKKKKAKVFGRPNGGRPAAAGKP
jgi:arylsulfatase A-like enzyme